MGEKCELMADIKMRCSLLTFSSNCLQNVNLSVFIHELFIFGFLKENVILPIVGIDSCRCEFVFQKSLIIHKEIKQSHQKIGSRAYTLKSIE